MGFLKRFAVVVVVAGLVVAASTGVASAQATVGVFERSSATFACTPVLLTVNGSDQRDDSEEMNAVRDYFRQVVRRELRDPKAGAWVPVDYPAVPLSQYMNLIKAAITRLPNWDRLDRSINQGTKRLRETYSSVTKGCPGREVAMAGYSQGADVVQKFVGTLDAKQRRTVHVGLLGNPSFLPGADNAVGGFDPGLRGVRPYFRAATFNLKWKNREGLSGGYIDYCLKGDPVCNFSIRNVASVGRHLRYKILSTERKLSPAQEVGRYLGGMSTPSD